MLIGRIRPDQHAAAARTLADAFQDDPLLHLLAPDKRRRPAVGRWFFGVTVAFGMRWGHVWVDEDVSAVSVWLPPGSAWTARRSLRVGMGAFPLRVGMGAMVRVLQAAPALERLHAVVPGPHWYLMAIGTRSERRGTGLGRALVEAGTSRADATGTPCYLETSGARNVEFFGRRGFELTGSEEMHGYPIFGMVREPR